MIYTPITIESLEKLPLNQIKIHIYQIAKTNSTKNLKRKHTLDYRFKKNWIKCYEFFLNQQAKQENKIELKVLQGGKQQHIFFYTTNMFGKVVKKWWDRENNEWLAVPQGDRARFERDNVGVEIVSRSESQEIQARLLSQVA